ncbi:hypothetical protein P3S67_025067 [Capsicum chacoense]
MEVSRDKESNKHHLLEKQQLLDEIMAYEEEYSDEELGKKNIPDVKDLSDVNLTAKEDVTEVNLKNQKSTDVADVQQDEVGGTITNSMQSAVDTLLFGLSTPSTTKSLDVGASNKMIERHWDLPDNQISLDFPDAQYGSSSKDAVDIDKEEKLKYAFDGYNINQDFPNELMIDYSQWITVGLLKTHSAKKETDNHY